MSNCTHMRPLHPTQKSDQNDYTAVAVWMKSLPFLRLLGGQEKRRWVCAVVCYAQCVETGQPGSAIGKPSLEAVGGVTAAPIEHLFFLAQAGVENRQEG